ncbi:hypothetical protein BH10BDE1_BH10BDE1_33970 [soil metagenome]
MKAAALIAFVVLASPKLFAIPMKSMPPVIGCNELASVYQNEMTVPFKNFADARVRKCVKKQSVTSLNMPLYIATAFYDQSLKERAKAIQKLKSYSCETENTCKKLFTYIDAHLKATILTKTKDSVPLFSQLDSFRDKLHYDLNSDD